MHVVRLGQRQAEVGADVRAALAAWGAGDSVLGGVAVLGCRPAGAPRPVEAVIVHPRGLAVVLGADLPEPVSRLDAPLGAPWSVDGRPLLGTERGTNPALEGLRSATALASAVQSHVAEPLPVAAIVAVGPYAGQVTQPAADLPRGVRVISPSTTALLSATRELTTYDSTCSVGSAQALLRLLGVERARDLDPARLLAEGFAASPETERAGERTTLIPKISAPRQRISRRAKLIAGVAAAAVLAALLAIAWSTRAPLEPTAAQRVDGVEFTERTASMDTGCQQHSSGELRSWFEQHRCVTLQRERHEAASAAGPVAVSVAVSVAVVSMADPAAAEQLRALVDRPGTRGIHALGEQFAGAARAVRLEGASVRIAEAAWSGRESHPDDEQLRAMAHRALQLTPR